MKNLAFLLLLTTSGLSAVAADATLSLAGRWRFQLDRADAGLSERWFERALPDKIRLPGTLTEQGVGDPVSVETEWIGSIVDRSWFTAPEYAKYREPGNVKIPFWLQPELYYAGVAWFQRDMQIPQAWRNKRIVLFLERAHWETRVWLDGKLIGTNISLATPHEYDLGQLTPGKHTLTLRVDNRMVIDVGENSHCVSDHTQGNWNGIVGKIELRATSLVWIEDVQLYPRIADRKLVVKGQVGNATGEECMVHVALGLITTSRNAETERTIPALLVPATGTVFEAELPIEAHVALWDEFDPKTYRFTATLRRAQAKPKDFLDRWERRPFSVREISTDGTQFTINGHKSFFRGTLECAIFPKTGHPPTEVESWKRNIRIAKAHGLNMMRFHSWCPPEAAFSAADELGFYFQIETCWPNQSTTLGDGKPVDNWVQAETERILKYYGNHPSFVLMAHGNEPGGKNANAFLARYVEHFKARDPRRLWTSGSGWPQLPENQFHVTPDPRVQGWGQGLRSRINGQPPETTTDYRDYIRERTVPAISHEIGQWCVYPNFDEIPKYTGYLKPRNFEIFRDRLKANGMGKQARQFLLASGKLQALCYKEDIESALRTPGMGGFHLLDLHDFPGQGTALVGVLDPFWDEKGYITAREFSRFCNSTVPLARLKKRVFTTDEKLEVELEVAHFGAEPLEKAVTRWTLEDEDGIIHARGQLPAMTLPLGTAHPVGRISLELKDVPAPLKYRLVVGIERTAFQNDWDVWVYPRRVDTAIPAGTTVVEELNDAALSQLNAGGKVLLTLPPRRVAPDEKLGKIALGFSSIFWNTAWTARQPPHTLGILVEPSHPLFAAFPTEPHSNWQWWYLIHRAGAMILDDLPSGLRPTVQVIDDWVTNRKLGLLFEAKVGAGKLIVCSIDLESDLESDPVRRQFRHSLLRYMSGTQFKPTTSVTAGQLRQLFAQPSARVQKLGILKLQADSEEIGNEAENVIDANPDTIWHTPWRGEPTGYPHHLQVEFKSPRRLRGFTALPRQDGNRNGWIRDYAFYASDDGNSWGEPVVRGTFAETRELKTVLFEQPTTGRFFKFVALSSFAGQYASMAELSVLEAAQLP